MRACSLCITALVLAAAATARADPDLDCRSPVRTPDIALCAQERFEAADARLNAAYRAALAAIGRANVPADARVDWRKAMVEAQRRWLAFATAECKAVGYSWYGGAGRSGAELDCWTKLSDARSKQLRLDGGLK